MSNYITPIKLENGVIYYPIYHKKLYRQYYISYQGHIYNFLNRKVTRYNIDDLVTFDDISFTIKELIWRSFYRFPNGKYSDLDKKIDIHKMNDHGDVYYVIEGVEFKPVLFPNGSIFYKEFIIKDKCQLLASDDGALFNIRTKKFFMFKIDARGDLYVNSKSGIQLKLKDILLYSWFSDITTVPNIRVYNIAKFDLFTNKDTLVIIDMTNSIPKVLKSSTIVQYIGEFEGFSQYLMAYDKHLNSKEPPITKLSVYDVESTFGKLYDIPMDGLYRSYSITRTGILYSNKMGTVIAPQQIIFDERTDMPIDILYRIPKLGKILSVIDILMWAFNRISANLVADYIVDIGLHTKYNLPVVNSLLTIAKPHYQSNDSYIIDNETFLKSKRFPHLFISKYGTIIDSDACKFINLNIGCFYNYHKEEYVIPIISKNKRKWVNYATLVYESWFRIKVPSCAKIVFINGIYADASIFNLRLAIKLSNKPSKLPNILTLKNISDKIEELNRQSLNMLCDVYKFIEGSSYNEK